MNGDNDTDLIEAFAAKIAGDQRLAEDLAALRDGITDEWLSLRKLGLVEHVTRLQGHSGTCARLANEVAIGIEAMTRDLDAAKTLRISLSTIAAGSGE